MKVGIPGGEILLTAQELPEDLADLVANGVLLMLVPCTSWRFMGAWLSDLRK